MPVRENLVPLSDGAGEVVEVGLGVTRVKVGDRVAGCFFQRWSGGVPSLDLQASALGGRLDGMLAEYAVLEEDGVVKIPEHLSMEEGATLPCAAVTAWESCLPSWSERTAEPMAALHLRELAAVNRRSETRHTRPAAATAYFSAAIDRAGAETGGA